MSLLGLAMISLVITDEFRRLRDELFRKHPEAEHEAGGLAESVLDATSASADEVWRIVWQRPIYAGRHVKAANNWIARLENELDGAWRQIASTPDAFRIDYIAPTGTERVVGKGVALADSSFDLVGTTVVAWKASKLPSKVINAMVEGGRSVARRAALNSAPFADLAGMDVGDSVDMVMSEFGRGWGHISALHFLTEFGLACKPDIHLVRASKALGLFDAKRDQVSRKDALAIVEQVKALTLSVYGRADGGCLRLVDKVLMDVSKYGIVENPFAQP